MRLFVILILSIASISIVSIAQTPSLPAAIRQAVQNDQVREREFHLKWQFLVTPAVWAKMTPAERSAAIAQEDAERAAIRKQYESEMSALIEAAQTRFPALQAQHKKSLADGAKDIHHFNALAMANHLEGK